MVQYKLPKKVKPGVQFGYLVVLEKSDVIDDINYWLCQCRCTRKRVVSETDLLGAKIWDCGLNHNGIESMSVPEEITDEMIDAENVDYHGLDLKHGPDGTVYRFWDGSGIWRRPHWFKEKYNLPADYEKVRVCRGWTINELVAAAMTEHPLDIVKCDDGLLYDADEKVVPVKRYYQNDYYDEAIQRRFLRGAQPTACIPRTELARKRAEIAEQKARDARKREPPPKNPMIDDKAVKVVTEVVDPNAPPKRKRGRPRKHPLPQDIKDPDADLVFDNAVDDVDTNLDTDPWYEPPKPAIELPKGHRGKKPKGYGIQPASERSRVAPSRYILRTSEKPEDAVTKSKCYQAIPTRDCYTGWSQDKIASTVSISPPLSPGQKKIVYGHIEVTTEELDRLYGWPPGSAEKLIHSGMSRFMLLEQLRHPEHQYHVEGSYLVDEDGFIILVRRNYDDLVELSRQAGLLTNEARLAKVLDTRTKDVDVPLSRTKVNHQIWDGEEWLTLTALAKKYGTSSAGPFALLRNGYTVDMLIAKLRYPKPYNHLIRIGTSLYDKDEEALILIPHYPENEELQKWIDEHYGYRSHSVSYTPSTNL